MFYDVITIAVLILLSGVCSGTETAFTSISLIQKKELFKMKSKRSKIALSLVEKPDLLLTSILIGNNAVNIGVTSFVTTFVIELFGSSYVGYATGILTFLVLIFGEITPKQVAITYNMNIVLFMAPIVRFFTIILYPIVYIVRGISNFFSKFFNNGKGDSLSIEGILNIFDAAEAEGVVDEYESDLVEKVLYFSETQTKTIMTHRSNLFKVSEELTIKDSFHQIIQSGFSRIPLYGKDPLDITGVLLLRDLLKEISVGNDDIKLKELMKEPLFVPESLHIDKLFAQLKLRNIQIAIVIDEYGVLSGIITLEDVVEELFGELYDEHEKVKPDAIVKTSDNSYIVQSEITIQHLIDELELEIPNTDRSLTVATYLMNETEKLLELNDVLDTYLGQFKITKMDGRKVVETSFIPVIIEEK